MSANSWDDQTIGDVARMNRTTIVSGTGAYLASLDKTKHKLFHCTSTGSGFTADHVYVCKTDGTGVEDISAVLEHNHTTSSTQGGDYWDILQANHDLVDIFFADNIDKNMWTEVVSGTGSTDEREDHADYTDNKVLKCLTGSTSGSGANLRIGSLPLTYTEESSFQALIQLSSSASIAFKYGYAMENITSAEDNSRKYGFSGCTSVNGNWFAYTADGDSRSSSDMGVAFTTSITNILAHEQEDISDIDFWINAGNKLTKTTDTPTNGEGQTSNHFRFGIKNNAASDKHAYLLKLRMTYHTLHDQWWPED